MMGRRIAAAAAAAAGAEEPQALPRQQPAQRQLGRGLRATAAALVLCCSASSCALVSAFVVSPRHCPPSVAGDASGRSAGAGQAGAPVVVAAPLLPRIEGTYACMHACDEMSLDESNRNHADDGDMARRSINQPRSHDLPLPTQQQGPWHQEQEKQQGGRDEASAATGGCG